MANALYNSAKEYFITGGIDVSNGNVKVLLVKSTYSVDLVNHEFVSDIGSSNIAARSDQLDNTTVTDGVFDASNETVESIGLEGFDYIILYSDTGDDSTSKLIAYIDTGEGLPVSSSDTSIDITIKWSDEPSKIFSL